MLVLPSNGTKWCLMWKRFLSLDCICQIDLLPKPLDPIIIFIQLPFMLFTFYTCVPSQCLIQVIKSSEEPNCFGVEFEVSHKQSPSYALCSKHFYLKANNRTHFFNRKLHICV